MGCCMRRSLAHHARSGFSGSFVDVLARTIPRFIHAVYNFYSSCRTGCRCCRKSCLSWPPDAMPWRSVGSDRRLRDPLPIRCQQNLEKELGKRQMREGGAARAHDVKSYKLRGVRRRDGRGAGWILRVKQEICPSHLPKISDASGIHTRLSHCIYIIIFTEKTSKPF